MLGRNVLLQLGRQKQLLLFSVPIKLDKSITLQESLAFRHIFVQKSQLSTNNSNFSCISMWHSSHFQYNFIFPETILSTVSNQTLNFILSFLVLPPVDGCLLGAGPCSGSFQSARLPEGWELLGAAQGC